jgi:chemotaxis methyl-accepting protein methylase/signal transduction histidine kinase
VVGIGASAGGLDALVELFDALPGDTGAAYLVAFHLDPGSVSHLQEILARHTPMPVQEAEDGTVVEGDRVYVGLPGRTLTLRDGELRVERLEERPQDAWSLDALFLSLAEELGPRAVAIVLSGSGAHGVAGAGQVRAAAGLVIAQDPATAGHGSMPRAVVHAGVADLVLAPRDIPGPLVAYLGHPYITRDEVEEDGEAERLEEVLTLIRVRLGKDFRSYKRPTLLRRLRRRLGLSRRPTLEGYVDLLRRDDQELRALSEDLTIRVSGFFRDPEMWEVLRERVIAPLVEERPAGTEVRIWVPGCATGEEAYSFGLLFAEEAERASKHFELKVFATDTADSALGTARVGLYPAAALEHLDPAHLRRYFTSRGSFFQVREGLRQTVIFSHHDLLRSPPFSRMDVVSYRNVLIYLVPEVQRRLIGLFHFALREGGALVLGKSESVGERPDLFEPVSKVWRIYRRVGDTRHAEVDFPVAGPPARVGVGDEEEEAPAGRRRPEPSFERLELRPVGKPAAPPRNGEATVEELEGELLDARQDLQSTVEALESANEELQSMNEELQTSQEELQSMNEELATVNAQLEEKVLALEGARRELADLARDLERRVEERTGLVQLLQDVTGIANTAGSVVEAMERALARIAPRDGWQVGHVYWVDETGEVAPSAIWYQEPGAPEVSGFKAQTAARRFAPGEGLVGRVLERKEPEWISDLEAEPGRLLRDVAATGLRAAIAFPLLVEREVLGVIEFFSSRPIEPAPEQLVVMASIGIQLGQVVERSRAERRLADLTAREQQRLGEELHEGLSQQVTGLAMLARSLHRRLVDREGEEADLAAELVEDLETARIQVRDLSKGLVSEHLGARSVVEALEDLAEEVCRTYEVDCRVEVEEGLEVAEGRLATALYRIGREALNNALVHARAKTVVIRLGRRDGRIVLEVEDDGVGLPEDFEATGGLGLRIMRDRAAMLGGEVRFEAWAGGGARVRCVLPERAGRGG